MGIAKSGIAVRFARNGARGLFWLVIVLAALPYSAAQEKGSRDKVSLAQVRFARPRGWGRAGTCRDHRESKVAPKLWAR